MTTELISTGAESAALLRKCEERITSYAQNLKRGEMLNDGWRFLMGAQMVLAKPHVPHGNSEGDGFQKWLAERWPDIEERTARNWMRGATVLIENWQAGKFLPKAHGGKTETVSFFKSIPEKLSNGDLTDDERQLCFDGLSEVTGGSLLQFARQHSKPRGGARRITFPCPHCQHENKGVIGREIKCGGCGKKIEVKPERDPETALKEDTKHANAALNDVLDAMVLFFESGADKQAALLTNDTWTRALATVPRFSTWLGKAKTLRGKGRK